MAFPKGKKAAPFGGKKAPPFGGKGGKAAAPVGAAKRKRKKKGR